MEKQLINKSHARDLSVRNRLRGNFENENVKKKDLDTSNLKKVEEEKEEKASELELEQELENEIFGSEEDISETNEEDEDIKNYNSQFSELLDDEQEEHKLCDTEIGFVNQSIKDNPSSSKVNPSISKVNPSSSMINPSLSKASPSSSMINPSLSNLNPSRSKKMEPSPSENEDIHTLKNKNTSSYTKSELNINKKVLTAAQLEIQKKLNFPGNSFVLVLIDKLKKAKAYDCALCYERYQRISLKEIIKHGNSKGHLLKVMELVSPSLANSYSKKETTQEIMQFLKEHYRLKSLDKDGVSFEPLSTNLHVRKTISNRILEICKTQKENEDNNMSIKNSETKQIPNDSARGNSSLGNKLGSTSSEEKNTNTSEIKGTSEMDTILEDQNTDLSKNKKIPKIEPTSFKDKTNLAENKENSKIGSTSLKSESIDKSKKKETPKLEFSVKDKITDPSKKTETTKSDPLKNNDLSKKRETSKIAPGLKDGSTILSKNDKTPKMKPTSSKNEKTSISKKEENSSFSDSKLNVHKKILTKEQLEIQNKLNFPGNSFVLVLIDKTKIAKAYDCVLCYECYQRITMMQMIEHGNSKEHLMKVMELVNPKLVELYSRKGTVQDIILYLKESYKLKNMDKDGVSFEPLKTNLHVRKMIYNKVLEMRKMKIEKEEKNMSNKNSKTIQVHSEEHTSSPSTGKISSPGDKDGDNCVTNSSGMESKMGS